MRRGSFVAPLLLIAIGVLFLLRNIYPEIRFMDYVGRFWPWVLIAWGTLRVAEILIWKMQDRPLPWRGVSGGEWALVLLLCLFGSGLHAAQGFTGWPGQFRINSADLFGEPFGYPVAAEKECTDAPHILVEAFRGDVQVSGADDGAGRKVKITGNKTVRSMERSDAENLARAVGVEITGEPNDLVIRPSRGSVFDNRRVNFHLEIAAPKGSVVEVRGQDGDISVADLASAVLSSDRSDVRIRNIKGHAEVSLRRGGVHVDAAGVPGQIEVSSGDVSASDVTGPLKISGRSGDVSVNRVNGTLDVDITRGDLNLRMGQLNGPIHAHSRSGDISLLLPPSTQFSLDASTASGDVSSTFDELKRDESGHNGSVRGKIGNGPAIELRTGRGDLSIVKSNAGLVGESNSTDKSDKRIAAPPPATELKKLDQ